MKFINSFGGLQGYRWASVRYLQLIKVALLSVKHLYGSAAGSGLIQLDQGAYLGPLGSLLVLTRLPFAALWGR